MQARWPRDGAYGHGEDAIGPLAASGGALDPQGPVARVMEDLWWLMLWASVIAGGIYLVALAVAIRRDETATESGEETTGTAGHGRWLVLGGVVLPTVVVIVVFGATVGGMRAIPTEAAEGDLVVEVVGNQWWWEVRYAEAGVVTANEVHIPAGRPVALRVTSSDVVHSFWVPELAGKIDLLPERTNLLVIEADEPGSYGGACAEFCGLQHTRMRITVVAHDPDDFETWLATEATSAAQPVGDQAARGAELFLANDCAQCHTIRGTEAAGTGGPDLTHLASRGTIGTSWENTPEQLETWIRDPHTLKEGVDMPRVELTDDEVDALVAYLAGLR